MQNIASQCTNPYFSSARLLGLHTIAKDQQSKSLHINDDHNLQQLLVVLDTREWTHASFVQVVECA